MREKWFLAGVALVFICFWLVNNRPIHIPIQLENIGCPIEEHKAALINFGEFQLYQPCLHPSNVKNGIRDLDIHVYYTGSKVDCTQTDTLMCQLLSGHFLSQDKNFKMTYANYNLESPVRSQFNFGRVDVPSFGKPLGSYLKIDAKELITPKEIAVELPIYCDSVAHFKGYGARCNLYFTKFGVPFYARYERLVEVPEFSTIDVLQDITLWLGVVNHLIVEPEK